MPRAFGGFCCLALTAVAHAAAPKVISLDITQESVFPVAQSGSSSEILRIRAQSVQAKLFNAQSDLLYLVNVTVGTPPQSLQLQIDTGSSDIWLPWVNSQVCSGRVQRCNEGSYSNKASSSYSLLAANKFEISYVDNTKITGDYIQDVFSVGGISIPKMTMGLAKSAAETETSSDFEGIMGIGFDHGEAYYAQTGQSYPNLISQLVSTGAIHTKAYSLFLNDRQNGVGNVLFGGIDTGKYKGPLVALPIQTDSRTSEIVSFTVAMDGFKVTDGIGATPYERTNLALPVIFDSGTTITYLPDDIALRLYQGVSAVESKSFGIVCPCDVASSNATFEFTFGNANGIKIVANLGQFVLPFPTEMAPTFKGSGKVACRWGIQASAGKPNLFGDTFLRGAYVVYNLENNQVAVAQAVLNSTKTNVVEITGKELPGVTATASGKVTNYAAVTPGIMGPNTLGKPHGHTQSQQIGVAATGTMFNLGETHTSTGTPSSRGAHKGTGGRVGAPERRDTMAVVVCVTIGIMCGGMLVLMA